MKLFQGKNPLEDRKKVMIIQHECIKLIQSDSKGIYNEPKISNKCCSLEIFIHQRILESFYNNLKQHNCF